jgi:hypothetical protein
VFACAVEDLSVEIISALDCCLLSFGDILKAGIVGHELSFRAVLVLVGSLLFPEAEVVGEINSMIFVSMRLSLFFLSGKFDIEYKLILGYIRTNNSLRRDKWMIRSYIWTHMYYSKT